MVQVRDHQTLWPEPAPTREYPVSDALEATAKSLREGGYTPTVTLRRGMTCDDVMVLCLEAVSDLKNLVPFTLLEAEEEREAIEDLLKLAADSGCLGQLGDSNPPSGPCGSYGSLRVTKRRGRLTKAAVDCLKKRLEHMVGGSEAESRGTVSQTTRPQQPAQMNTGSCPTQNQRQMQTLTIPGQGPALAPPVESSLGGYSYYGCSYDELPELSDRYKDPVHSNEPYNPMCGAQPQGPSNQLGFEPSTNSFWNIGSWRPVDHERTDNNNRPGSESRVSSPVPHAKNRPLNNEEMEMFYDSLSRQPGGCGVESQYLNEELGNFTIASDDGDYDDDDYDYDVRSFSTIYRDLQEEWKDTEREIRRKFSVAAPSKTDYAASEATLPAPTTRKQTAAFSLDLHLSRSHHDRAVVLGLSIDDDWNPRRTLGTVPIRIDATGTQSFLCIDAIDEHLLEHWEGARGIEFLQEHGIEEGTKLGLMFDVGDQKCLSKLPLTKVEVVAQENMPGGFYGIVLGLGDFGPLKGFWDHPGPVKERVKGDWGW